jgi:hypothetical protein
MKVLRLGSLLLVVSLTIAGIAGACGGSSDETGLLDGGDGDGTSPIDGGFNPDGFNLDGSPTDPDANLLAIKPLDPVVDVTTGTPTPTVSFTATWGGAPISASWSIDRGEIGTVGVASGVFTPSGKIGGVAHVTAAYAGKSASTSVTVKIHVVQNGDPTGGCVKSAGGCGGVGGEGSGKSVDPTVKGVLDAAPTADPGTKFLYPYDQTVWPRGILAPLMQWATGKSFDAVKITLKENSFDYTGYFAKTATPFVHHPVPEDVWKDLAYSNGGPAADPVSVELVFAAGGATIGPIKQTWKIAPGTLKGTVYYNSYGTNLAHNYCCTIGGARFGGATLGIKPGASDPTLVAGSDSSCRTCHSVAANGSVLVTQHGEDYNASSVFDLKTLAETPMSPADSRFAFPALAPDGTYLFANSAPVPGTGYTGPSQLFAVPSGAPIASTGLPGDLRAGCPAFSPDSKHLAFNLYGGAGSDQRTLSSLAFDPTTKAFTGPTALYTPPAGVAVWPSFLPTNDAVIFELETVSHEFGATRDGVRAELWWIDLATKTPKRLDQLDGTGYLPTGAAGHDADTTLQYEPTVNPVASGGFAWVVFTSRRMYGNVATVDPFWSDPRSHDISVAPTTKKLWVAAIDLGAAPGTDPSHPAFYLPGQELLAGNSRGYWVVDPCKPDLSSCETGDECCGGYCRPAADGGFTCTSDVPKCAAEFEKCTKDSDCCGYGSGITCIDGRCARKGPS